MKLIVWPFYFRFSPEVGSYHVNTWAGDKPTTNLPLQFYVMHTVKDPKKTGNFINSKEITEFFSKLVQSCRLCEIQLADDLFTACHKWMWESRCYWSFLNQRCACSSGWNLQNTQLNLTVEMSKYTSFTWQWNDKVK